MQFGLSLVAVNIVLGDLGVRAPEPFHVPHPSRDVEERSRLREVVHRDLERRGLMRRGRLDADAEEVLRAFVSAPLALLVVGVLEDDGLLFARVACTPNFAVRVVQDGQRLQFTEVRRTGVVPAAVSLLPGGVPAAPGHAVTVPAVGPKTPRREDEDFENSLSVREQPASRADAGNRALQRLQAKPRLRVGTIMVQSSAVPEGGGALRETARRQLTWFDTEDGRYMHVTSTSHDGSQWITVAPADSGRIAQHLAGWVDG